jgi:carboxymethylenebutenolidase
VMGFCMGGMLTFVLAALRPDRIKAIVPFYGFPSGDDQPDYSKITAAIQGHMAEHDDFFGPAGAHELESKLKALGKDVTITVHPGTGHAFMAPHNALGTRDDEAYARIWPQAVGFLHEHLG